MKNSRRRASEDFYKTEDWAPRALFEREPFEAIADPFCGSGTIVRAAREMGIRACGSDIVGDAHGCKDAPERDFLVFSPQRRHICQTRDIVCNPPYKGAIPEVVVRIWKAHVLYDYVAVSRKLAMLLPLSFLEGETRNASSGLFLMYPPSRIYVCASRVNMPPGHVARRWKKKKPEGGRRAFAWFVWEVLHTGEPKIMLPGLTRRELHDYRRYYPAASEPENRPFAGEGVPLGADASL